MKIEIELEGMSELLAAFKGVEAGMLDFRQLGAWDAVQSEFYKIEKEQFASEGSSGRSGKWKALSPKYAAIKQRKYGAMPILQATGKGYRSLTSADADGAVVVKEKQELVLGTSIPYMAYHQKGGGRLPKREPISMTDDHIKRLSAPVNAKLKQLIANAKLRELRGF